MKNNFYITPDNELLNRYDGADNKKTVVDEEGQLYLLKLPSIAKNNKEASYSNNIFSEYICCHIFETIGIKAQQTYLGTFLNNKGIEKNACACRDFTTKEWELIEFQKLRNSYDEISNNSQGGSTNLEDIKEVLNNHPKITEKGKEMLKKHFWDMFVVDALIGNFDRHNGNWGILVNDYTQEIKVAPIYDCGSCLYAQLTDEQMAKILESQQEINIRIYERPLSALQLNNKKINYYDFISSLESKECNEALQRIVPKINMDKINDTINSTPYISDVRKEFYRIIIKKRYEKILNSAYERIQS